MEEPADAADYARAPWALGFAVLAMVLRVVAGVLELSALGFGGHGRANSELAGQLIPVFEVLGTVAALAGIAYAAIASHRSERGVVLVLAWILAVAAALFRWGVFPIVVF